MLFCSIYSFKESPEVIFDLPCRLAVAHIALDNGHPEQNHSAVLAICSQIKHFVLSFAFDNICDDFHDNICNSTLIPSFRNKLNS